MNIKKVIDVWVSQVSIPWVMKVKNLNTERGLGDLSQHRCMNINKVIDVWVSQGSIQWVMKVKNLNT